MISFKQYKTPRLVRAWQDPNVGELVEFVTIHLDLIEALSSLLTRNVNCDHFTRTREHSSRAWRNFLRDYGVIDEHLQQTRLPGLEYRLYRLVEKIYLESSEHDDEFLGILRGAAVEKLLYELVFPRYEPENDACVGDCCSILCDGWESQKTVDVAAWSPERLLVEAYEAKVSPNRLRQEIEIDGLLKIEKTLTHRFGLTATMGVVTMHTAAATAKALGLASRSIRSIGWDNFGELMDWPSPMRFLQQ